MNTAWFTCVVLMAIIVRPMLLATQKYSSVTDLIASAKCEALGISAGAGDRKDKTQWLSHETSGMQWNDCIRTASRDISIVPWKGESPIAEPVLICRDEMSFTVGWNLSSTHDLQDEPVLYAIELLNSTRSGIWEPLNTTKDQIITIDHLTAGVTYKVRVTAVMAEGQLGRPVNSSDLRTLSGEKIKPVEYADVVKQNVDENGLSAVIKWYPSPDKPCYYEIVKWVPYLQESSIVEVKDVRLNIDTTIYMTLSDLEFDTNYSIAITAEGQNWAIESDKFWLSFYTPTCLHAHNWSLTICAPQKPEGLSAIATPNEKGDYLCDVMVAWERPQAVPDFYVLSITHYTDAHWSAQKSQWLNKYQVNATVNGSSTDAVFRGLKALPKMMVTLIAVSEGGRSKETKIHRNSCIINRRPTPQNYSTDTSRAQPEVLLWSVTAFCLFITLSTAAILVFICRYQSRRKQKKKRAQYSKNLEKDESGCREWANHKDIDEDEFEIARDRILISQVLGTGAFGVVHKGLLTNGAGLPTEIAVKTLRENPAGEEIRQLTKEIAILKSVGRHRNIASMIGCCTRGTGIRSLLIIEFCAFGDLQNFLRQAHKIISRVNVINIDEQSESDRGVTYADLMASSSSDSPSGDIRHGQYETLAGFPVVMNRTYDIDNSKFWHAVASLSASDLLSFTRQIAMGMEFLAKNKVVHRDLAARNVLVCSDLTMKISDFGLSRDIYEQNFYSKKGSERLPVKWMAIESFLHQIYTTQSDVWSFGVLLWEIVTLGGNPYPSVPTSDIFRLLKQGHRMEQPSSCGKELYDIMLACWTSKPKDRPTFSQLVLKLDELLEQVSPQEYLNLKVDLSTMDHTDSSWD